MSITRWFLLPIYGREISFSDSINGPYIIKGICKDFDSLEIDRITYSDYIYSVIINHHKFNGAVEAIEIRLYDICQYFEHEKTERGRRKDVVFDDIDRCMQALCPYRKISMVTMEVEE